MKKTTAILISCILLLSCDNANESYSEEYLTLRSDNVSSATYGTIKGTVTGNTVNFDWNYPMGDDGCEGYLISLKSSRYGTIASIETVSQSQKVGSGTLNFNAEYLKGAGVGSLSVEVRGCTSSIVSFPLIDIGGGTSSGQSTPKCEHKFIYRETELSLSASLNNTSIEGHISCAYNRPCVFIMRYSSYNPVTKASYSSYVVKEFRSTVGYSQKIIIPWSDAMYISQNFNMSPLSCEIRIYDLSCTKGVPPYDQWNISGSCTNYLSLNFTVPAGQNTFLIPSVLRIIE